MVKGFFLSLQIKGLLRRSETIIDPSKPLDQQSHDQALSRQKVRILKGLTLKVRPLASTMSLLLQAGTTFQQEYHWAQNINPFCRDRFESSNKTYPGLLKQGPLSKIYAYNQLKHYPSTVGPYAVHVRQKCIRLVCETVWGIRLSTIASSHQLAKFQSHPAHLKPTWRVRWHLLQRLLPLSY